MKTKHKTLILKKTSKDTGVVVVQDSNDFLKVASSHLNDPGISPAMKVLIRLRMGKK